MKHTPGPWEVGSHRGNAIYEVRQSISHLTVGEGISIQNANLFAAAPDLLEALESLLEVIPEHEEAPAKVWIAARAAIKKARGE